MKILVTAFDAFGGETINPAQEVLRQVCPPDGVELIRLEVPTVFGASVEAVAQAMKKERPQAVLCIGQAGGRVAVTPERVAINVMDARIPDNAGQQPVDEPVCLGGENALFATIPNKKIVEKITAAGIPSQLSNTAGTFVCNQLLYGVLHLCQTQYPEVRAGFIHVPYLPEQIKESNPAPSLPLEDSVAAIEIALRCIAAE